MAKFAPYMVEKANFFIYSKCKILYFFKMQMQQIFIQIFPALQESGRESFYEQFGFVSRPNDHKGCGMNMFLKKE